MKDYEVDKLRQRCIEYVNDIEPTAHLAMGEFTYTRMKMCFEILKSMANSIGASQASSSASGGGNNHSTSQATAPSLCASGSNNNQELEHRILELEQLVQQRDNEIAIMVDMIRKEKAGGGGGATIPENLLTRQLLPLAKEAGGSDNQRESQKPQQQQRSGSKAAQPPMDTSFTATFRVDPAVLEDPTKSFESFKTHYPKNDVIRENKILLKQKYDAAKDLANAVNDARNQIKHLTLQIEKLRKQQAITENGLVDDSAGGGDAKTPSSSPSQLEETAAENKLKDKIEQCKLTYKKGFHELSELKKEIQHIQKMLEMSRIKLQKDFDLWYQRQGKGALLTEALVAQPKGSSDAPTAGNNSNSQRPGAAVKSVSPARPEMQAKSSFPSPSASEKESAWETAQSVEMKKPATTPRSSSAMRSSTAR